jgi:hypothetical protein
MSINNNKSNSTVFKRMPEFNELRFCDYGDYTLSPTQGVNFLINIHLCFQSCTSS